MVDKRLLKKKKEEKVSKEETNNKEEEKVVRKKPLLTKYDLNEWTPRTELGRKVYNKEITSLDEIFDRNLRIFEPQIVDYLVDINEKVIDITKTAYVRMSGRKYNFRVAVLVGDGHSYVGIGIGKDKDRIAAITKAAKKARLNLVRVKHGCGAWECTCGSEHSVPFRVEGKCSAVRVDLKPAPRGAGLVVADSIKDVFRMCGIKDVYGKGFGQTSTTINFVKATIDALSKTNRW